MDPVVIAPRSRLKAVFKGPDGLRAGYRVIIYLALVGLVSWGVYRGLAALGMPNGGLVRGEGATAMNQLRAGRVLLASVLIPLVLMKLGERRPWRDYAMAGPRYVQHLLSGAVVGLAGIALLCGVLVALGALSLTGPQLHGTEALQIGALWIVSWLLSALFEEVLFRAALFTLIERGMGWKWAAAISSVAFGLAHLGNTGEALIGVLSAGLIGVVFCWSVHRTGSIAWAWGVHAAWNWGQTFLFGVANSGEASHQGYFASAPAGAAWLSGGDTGPEGSVLAFVVIALFALVVHRQSSRSAA